MELLLWRWSTAVQIASALMVAVFFTAFAASVRTIEVRWWMRAWLANLAALGVTLFFWYFAPNNLAIPIRILYLGSKTLFVLFMLEGAWTVSNQRPLLSHRQRLGAVAVYAVSGGFLLTSLALIGIAQHSILMLAFGAAAVLMIRSKKPGSMWLAAGFIVRAALALAEAFAYTAPNHPKVSLFLSASSSFDSGAEWLLALGCVLVASARIQNELRMTNRDLLAAQDELRALVDRDPLTGLANRRSLPAVFRDVYDSGATILFFDLDGFKEINDVHGHQAGDETLKRFANALRASFRPTDAVVRYAGDEFLVIAPGLDPEIADEHLADLAERLRDVIAFSVGSAELEPGGNAEAAVRAADAAMYQTKGLRRAAV